MTNRCPNCNLRLSYKGRCPQCGQILKRKKTRYRNLSAAVGIVISLLFWFFQNGYFAGISFFPNRNGIFEVNVEPPAARVWGTSKPTFSEQELAEFRNLFEARQFDALNRAALQIQREFVSDSACEYKSHDFFYLFEMPIPEYEELFNEWVERHPRHFAPYLARAHYYYRMGWVSRGTDVAAKTSPEQFQGMRGYFEEALSDVETALSINPRLLTAYTIQIGIHNAEGAAAKEAAAFEKGRTYFPSCFLLYAQMLWANLPRWGGSYPEMHRIANQALDYVQRNPELYMLFGKIYADQAWILRKAKLYDQAIALYDKAIRYGEHYSFFLERGRTYLFMKDYDRALEDVEYSISLRPIVAEVFSLRAQLHARTENPYAAIRDIRTMEARFPADPETAKRKEWTARYYLQQGHAVFKKDLEQAVACYDLALEVDDQLVEAWFWRGSANSRLGRNDLARSDLRMVIEYDPHDFKAYQKMDYLLASERRWDEIIAYWDQYIAMEPDNADAYLERAGTYRHKGDMESALADLRQACDLGQQEACRYLKRYG